MNLSAYKSTELNFKESPHSEESEHIILFSRLTPDHAISLGSDIRTFECEPKTMGGRWRDSSPKTALHDILEENYKKFAAKNEHQTMQGNGTLDLCLPESSGHLELTKEQS